MQDCVVASGGPTRPGARWKIGPAFDLSLEASLTESASGEDAESGLLLMGAKRW